MKKQTKRNLAAALALIISLSSFTGCKKNNTADNSDEVKLKWIMIGDKQKDAEMVWEKFNEELKNYVPNTSVEFEMIPGSSFAQKWQLMNAASEKMDIAWTGYAVSFLDEINKGSYMVLDDIIKENAPDLFNELPEWLLNLGRVDGQLYEIPNYQMMATSPFGVHIRKEHEQYMDIPAIKEKFNVWESDPDNLEKGKDFLKEFEKYFENLKKAGKLNKGTSVATISGIFNPYTMFDSTTVSGFRIDTRTNKIVADALMPNRKFMYDTLSDWYEKGYIRSDIMGESVDGIDEAEKGYILWGHGYYNETSEKTESALKGFPTTVFGLGEKYYIKNSIPTTATALGRTCENPARAIKVVELMHTKKGADLYNLLTYGIEGTHYEKVSDNRIKTFDYDGQSTADSAYGLWKWAVGNTANAFENQGDAEGMAEYTLSLDNNAEILPTVGFKPDTSEISVEISQIKSVESEFKPLSYGALPDYEKKYDEYIAKLKSAGIETVREELQKQLDEWLKTK